MVGFSLFKFKVERETERERHSRFVLVTYEVEKSNFYEVLEGVLVY